MNTIEKNLDISVCSEADRTPLANSQLEQLKKFGAGVNKYGANFAVCGADGKLILLCESDQFKSVPEQLIGYSREVLRKDGDIHRAGLDGRVLCVALKSHSGLGSKSDNTAVALIDMEASDDFRDRMFSDMLLLLAENFQVRALAVEQVETVSAELSQVYEELVLLYKLSTNMRVTETDANFLQIACDSLTEIVNVEGIAILLAKNIEDENRFLLAAGSGLIDIDERMASILHCRLVDEINSGREALLDSEVDSPFKYDWPDNVRNIIVVPLFGKCRRVSDFSEGTHKSNNVIGLMVAINRIDKPDFDSPDVKLFNSVANGCAVFVENGRLFGDLKELFIGSLKALTRSIDAKDQYTRGHSERVAFIARWIAEKYSETEPLENEQIHKIYLAGLLHDIGKIGVDETVLRKNGKLTEQELKRIRTHPSIGAGILSQIKQMSDIVPGVLCHHERIDGRGYPNGLDGKEMPLMAKIIGLADSFDAMTSDRIYRKAMSLEEAITQIEKGLGAQFDEKVGTIFINSDIYQLWDIIRNGIGENDGYLDAVEYGTLAVGSII